MKSWAYGHNMYFLLNDIKASALLLAFGYVSSLRTPPLRDRGRDEILFFISLFIFSIFSDFTRLNIHKIYIRHCPASLTAVLSPRRSDPSALQAGNADAGRISRRNNWIAFDLFHHYFSGSQRTTGFSFLRGVHRIGVDIIHNPFI